MGGQISHRHRRQRPSVLHPALSRSVPTAREVQEDLPWWVP